MKKQITFSTLALFFICFSLCQNSYAIIPLKQSIDKYKDIEISLQAAKQLSPYNRLIDYYSQFCFFKPHHKVSPNFIRALILAESSANPKALSGKGAMGLGQIIYSTGKQAALELSQSKFRFPTVSRLKLINLKKEDLFDPEVNILLTCYLISKYNYKFNGKLELVLSAWNAGEYHKELKKGRPAPYQETHNLIGKVNGYYIALLQKPKKLTLYTRR